MVVERRFLVIFCLVLLIGSAAALDLSPSTISSSNPGWLIANDGNDQSTISVDALAAGTPATPVMGATVTFSLDSGSQDLGTISPVTPASVQTGADGKATAVFTTSKKSGNATIIASISYNDGSTTSVQVSTFQRIDHDTPQGATFENPAALPVGSITRVNVTLVDRWGNRIDNKNTAETIRLTMADEGGAGLQEGLNYISLKTYSMDAEGNVSADLRISTTVKSNYIQMDPIGNIVVPPAAYILGVAESEPHYIAQTPASPGSSLPADGDPAHAVEIYYTVTDKYHNPITGASVYCDSTDGMSVTAPTNTWGRLRISFGPKETTGIYSLRAIPLGNTSAVCTGINAGTVGNCSQDIEYYNTDPVDLTFTGNPQSMASLDVDPSTRAVLKARVIDIKGNPVSGEVVHFSLADATYPGPWPYVNTTFPSLSALSAPVDDASGYATVEFSPGAFKTYDIAGYNATATGQVVVTATWTNQSGVAFTRDITLVWKNYPYVGTSSLGDCGNSQVGDKINITIRLFGDGAALMPKPIDAELVIDKSLSMNGAMDGQTRLYWAKQAATTFVGKMNPASDQVGLVSYSTSASVDSNLSTVFSDVTNGINNIQPVMYTGTRSALKTAIEDVVAHRNPNPKTIQAIILMSDGEYNYYGDPLARGTGYDATHTDGGGRYYTWTSTYITRHTYFSGLGGSVNVNNANVFTNQNMSRYAQENTIRIYTISFGSDISSTSETWKTMEILSNATGGQHFHASTGSELIDVYTTIAGQLQETAGGETQVDLDFGTVNINDNPDLDITDYMDYEYHEGYSTYINKSNITKYGVYNQLFSETRNDEAAWNSRTMAFDVGTIKLNETWSATFQLNMTKAGNINLFGLGSSTLSFTDAATGETQTGFIPAMQCRVRESIVNTGFGSKTLRVDNLSFVEGVNPDPNAWTVKWNTTYDGDKTVQEAILYRVTGDPQWKTVPGGLVFISSKVFEVTNQNTLSTSDTALWPPGKCFDIQIVAGAEDANAAITNQITKCKALPGGTIFIKLE
ncbi:MAG: VWA domain-containing protein [Methanoregula sp.]